MLRPAQVFRLRTHHWDWFIHLPRLKRLVGLWLLFLALAHWIACVWWWIGTSSFNFGYVNVDGEPISPWVFRMRRTDRGFAAGYAHAGLAQQYWTCFYWSLTVLVKVPWVAPHTWMGGLILPYHSCT